MSLATDVADDLRVRLGKPYVVRGFLPTVDAVPHPTVAVWQTRVVKAPLLGHNVLQFEITVQVIVGEEDMAAADRALDVALLDVLDALQRISLVDWTGADRVVREDAHHAYNINCQALAKIGE
ncbi:hypothetical protein EXU48_15685 [Occultella glacieicola]|uniref:DUF3168 domain-containing protein n=1 Tax=Occultella glacieicola TaxID=2518684 RepID=A0ABY2E0U9_9MICO|nr:hypothetical protein [Occultella glacieicola]TDE91586.1 hypothetical protein EXU48_15685 [Occultella glacieicola]